MPAAGQTTVDFNQKYFDQILKSAGIVNLVEKKAEQAAKIARSTAPVDTGSYRDQIEVERAEFRYRTGFHIVGHDPKSLLIEAKTGNLARALKKVRS